jgi:predicted dehydrogenase
VSLQDIVGLLSGVGLGTWFTDGALAGGGAAISHGIHMLDLVRYLTGLDYTRVSAMARYDEPMRNGAESDLTATMELRNGALATLQVSSRAVGQPQGPTIALLYESGCLSFPSATGGIALSRGFDYATLAPRQPSRSRSRRPMTTRSAKSCDT